MRCAHRRACNTQQCNLKTERQIATSPPPRFFRVTQISVCNPGTWDTEAAGSLIRSHPGLHK